MLIVIGRANVIMLNVVMLNVVMLNVIMLNVVMLNVVAPLNIVDEVLRRNQTMKMRSFIQQRFRQMADTNSLLSDIICECLDSFSSSTL
jgi:cell division protein ZapA (FtsZ GTPase activity inhibitor)